VISSRNITILVGLVALAGLGLGLGLGLSGSEEKAEIPPAAETGAADEAPGAKSAVEASDEVVSGTEPDVPGELAPDEAADTIKPTFDVVRISPSGDAVIAGRAAPGAEITVMLDGEKEIGTVRADERGEWVLLPSEPLPPGTHEFTLSSRLPNGAVIESDQAVVLVAPDPGKALAEGETGEQAMAVIVPREGEGASTVLQHPGEAEGTGPAASVVLDTLDYDESGTLILSGRGRPDGSVRAYLDNNFIGGAPIDADGRWRIVPEAPLAPGLYTLRLDELGSDGSVVARIETPLSRARLEETELAPGQALVVVQPGNSLWRIARRIYGGGVHYTLIFEANSDQIRDVDLIYPGQILALPKGD